MSSEQSPPDGVRIPISLNDIPSHPLFMRSPPEELFHYTSLDGARGIVESKSLHLTRVAHLNDRSELGLAIRLFQGAVDRIIPTVIDSDRKSLLTEAAHQLGSFAHTNICVASFCEEPDLLSQWRAYAASGKGVALGFSSEVLQHSCSAQLVCCVYNPAQQNQIAEELVGVLLNSYDTVISNSPSAVREDSRQSLIGYFNTTFLRVAPALKDRHFSEEKEWRMVTLPQKITDPKFRAFVSNSRVSEYYVNDFAPDQNGSYNFLPTMVLGPTHERELIGSALEVLCMRQNVRVKHIRYSQIPYRG